MTTDTMPDALATPSAATRLLRAGVLTGVVDGLWAVALTLAYGRTVTRLWQGVAATAFGERMLSLGLPGALVGVAVHFGVAFAWSAVLLLLVSRWRLLHGVLSSAQGVAAVALVWGPVIWVVMSAVVIPLRTGKPLAITGRWWIQLAGHALFVGLPMVWAISGRWPRRATAAPLVSPAL